MSVVRKLLRVDPFVVIFVSIANALSRFLDPLPVFWHLVVLGFIITLTLLAAAEEYDRISSEDYEGVQL